MMYLVAYPGALILNDDFGSSLTRAKIEQGRAEPRELVIYEVREIRRVVPVSPLKPKVG